MVNKWFALATVSAVTGLVLMTSASGCTTTEVVVQAAPDSATDARGPTFGDNEEPATTIACLQKVPDLSQDPYPYESPLVKAGACKADVLPFIENYLKTAPATATIADFKTALQGYDTSAGKTCAACIFSPPTADSKWAPFVEEPDGDIINTGGCIEIASGNSGCGKAYFFADLCLQDACGQCTSDADNTACGTAATAATGDCATYFATLKTACGANLQQYLTTCSQNFTYTIEGPIQAQCIGGGISDAATDG
jgi:hypothetical protein